MRETAAKLRDILSILLVVVTAIVVIFVAQLTLEVRSELVGVKKAIQGFRIETAQRAAVEPFGFIEEKCATCHSDRKFLGVHGSSNALKQIIGKMEKLPDAHVSAQDRDKIHASLMLLKCVRCHDEVNLKKLAPMGEAQRLEVIRRMRQRPDSGMAPGESMEILKAYQQIQGF